MVCPSGAEQEAILEHIALENAEANRTIAIADREIALLREYRSRLITDVVTGKLDVREVAARLPDEVDEPELVNEVDALTNEEQGAAGDLDAATEEAEA